MASFGINALLNAKMHYSGDIDAELHKLHTSNTVIQQFTDARS